MQEFVPGHEYDRQQVRSALEATKVDDSFVVGREGMALIARVGAADDRLDFPERSTLRWRGEVPRRAVETKTKLLVFVDRAEKTVRFIGEGRAVHYSSRKGLPRDVDFAITPPLTRPDWLALMAGQLPPLGPAPEALLAKLTGRSTPHDRWTALEAFLERWYDKPLDEAPVDARKPIGPPLLREMLRIERVIPEVVRHNHLVQSEDLEVDDGKVVFLVENQGVCLWATEPASEDPRVWYRNNDAAEPWLEESERLSGFLIQAVLFEAIMHARFGASATAIPAATVDAILARVDPLGNDPWNWGGARFYARDGALVMTMAHEDVWLAARTPFALSPFEALVDDQWDHVAF